MEKAEVIVENLSNVQAISLLKRLNQMLYTAVTPQQVTSSVDSSIKGVDLLSELPLERKKENLTPEDSVRTAKYVLRSFALDDALAPALIQAWKEIKDDDGLFIEAIVAVGLIANLTLFLATSDIEFKIGGLHIKKKPADPETVKAVIEPISEMIKKTPL